MKKVFVGVGSVVGLLGAGVVVYALSIPKLDRDAYLLVDHCESMLKDYLGGVKIASIMVDPYKLAPKAEADRVKSSLSVDQAAAYGNGKVFTPLVFVEYRSESVGQKKIASCRYKGNSFNGQNFPERVDADELLVRETLLSGPSYKIPYELWDVKYEGGYLNALFYKTKKNILIAN